MSHETTATFTMNLHKRNGQVVAFNEIRIRRAIGNAFKEQKNLPREVELPIEVVRNVETVTASVTDVLKERFANQEHVTVEEVQDEVIRQLFENGFKEVGELYANYRKDHASHRALFELYSIVKRGGKIWLRIFPDKPISKKPAETRMGKGKGSPEYWVAVVKPGRIMYEMSGVPESVAKEAFRLASHKLSVLTRVVVR